MRKVHAYTDNLTALRAGFNNSLLVLGAYEQNELLGIIRVVGDGATIILIQDILIFFRNPSLKSGSKLYIFHVQF